ncbi:hypothetical protein OG895_36830 [Streptomyces sp. NBC_00201]|uniref:hypothetical protein n=1 Tax=Streptomyces sp. NBC_00201 TaxID=2975679 RepID=UPI00225A29A5|nr:hypothetical protein [Streptomyces sp. NBC_00201]MCX5250701.1 hypothetical protein [Streptomyces sp. NBC_00201]
MPDSWAGRALDAQPAETIDPTAGTRRHRLAVLLADMVPGARTVRVSQHQPSQTWPSPYTRAYDEQGNLIPLNLAQRVTARWVIRAYPEADWDEAHDLDLTTGTLRPAVEARPARGGGR